MSFLDTTRLKCSSIRGLTIRQNIRLFVRGLVFFKIWIKKVTGSCYDKTMIQNKSESLNKINLL